MNCRKIQDLLLTDYLDGEANDALKEKIERHLSGCSRCRAFEHTVFAKASQPLKKTEPAKPPDKVWYKIKEAILFKEEQRAKMPLEAMIGFLRNNLLAPKPAFALSGAITAIILAILVLQLLPMYRQKEAGNHLLEQSDFMFSLHASIDGDLEQTEGFGTAVEQYLF